MNLARHHLPFNPEERQHLIEQAWVSRITENEVQIAGPWVPYTSEHARRPGAVYRHSVEGGILAIATSQAEIVAEDARLKAWGYELTDVNRVIPDTWWNGK